MSALVWPLPARINRAAPSEVSTRPMKPTQRATAGSAAAIWDGADSAGACHWSGVCCGSTGDSGSVVAIAFVPSRARRLLPRGRVLAALADDHVEEVVFEPPLPQVQ